MKTVLGIVLACIAGSASAKTYLYTARTYQPVAKAGAVQAGSLVWSCRNTSCTISGPWAAPGVGACTALARKIGRIREYGHPGSKLSAARLKTCNQGAATSKTLRPLNTSKSLKSVKPVKRLPSGTLPKIPLPMPRLPAPAPLPRPSTGSSVAHTAPATSLGVETGLEEGSYGVFRLYVKTPGIAYHGSYGGAYPALNLGAPAPRWSGSVLRAPQISLVATPPAGESIRPHGAIPADSVMPGTDEGLFIDVPLNFRALPQAVVSLTISCAFSQVRQHHEGVFNPGNAPFSAQSVIGNAQAKLWARDDRQIRKTAHMPVKLRPFASKEDLRAVQCQADFQIARSGGGGINNVPGPAAINPASRRFVPGLAPVAGTTGAIRTTFNIGG